MFCGTAAINRETRDKNENVCINTAHRFTIISYKFCTSCALNEMLLAAASSELLLVLCLLLFGPSGVKL